MHPAGGWPCLLLKQAKVLGQQCATAMQLLDVGSNNITGNLSILENMPLATEFRFDGNALTGRVPSISPNVQVRRARCKSGQIDISQIWSAGSREVGLTGVCDPACCTMLVTCSVKRAKAGSTDIVGTGVSAMLQACCMVQFTALICIFQVFDVQDNTLSGSVPTIRGTALVEMRLSLNAGLT